MDSLRGQLLVASPHLPDPNFFRSVVLLIHHDAEGAFGVILNRPTDNTIQEVWEMISDQPCDCSDLIHMGGPVAGPLMILHTLKSCSESEILPRLHLATQKEHLQRVISRRRRPFRIFSGYAGWAAGQLESELEVGGWLTTHASFNDVFHPPEDLWKEVAQRIGLDILNASLKTKHVPEDPSMN